jgi:hypothetical protein
MGILTASEMKHIITPSKLQYASNDKERAHLYEITAQRISQYVEPAYISDDMLRGMDDECEVKNIYRQHFGEIEDVGFITNDKWGFVIGYSPDALVGNDGLIETKSRKQKFQIETILKDEMPIEYLIQVQTGLLVSQRAWCEFVSYCGGLPLYKKRIYPDAKVQEAIIAAAGEFYKKVDANIQDYNVRALGLIKTERKIEQEITV